MEIMDRFTTRATNNGWEVVDTERRGMVLALCPDQRVAQAVAWFFRADYETGTRLLLEAIGELEG